MLPLDKVTEKLFSSKYEVLVFDGSNIPKDMYLSYCHLRFRFIKSVGWDVPLNNSLFIETDKFDNLKTTTYILIVRKNPKSKSDMVVTGIRILPTIYPYQLEEKTYKFITDGVSLPKSKSIAEANRWCGSFNMIEDIAMTTQALMSKMREFCLGEGYEKVIGVVDAKLTESMDRIGADVLSPSGIKQPFDMKQDFIILSLDLEKCFSGAMNARLEEKRAARKKVA